MLPLSINTGRPGAGGTAKPPALPAVVWEVAAGGPLTEAPGSFSQDFTFCAVGLILQHSYIT